MSKSRNALIIEILDRLEQEEEKLLTWGVVDGAFSPTEVEAIAQQVITESGAAFTADELRQDLFDRRLLFAFRQDLADAYRTRMAEGVRLFARLRQMFPNRPWQI